MIINKINDRLKPKLPFPITSVTTRKVKENRKGNLPLSNISVTGPICPACPILSVAAHPPKPSEQIPARAFTINSVNFSLLADVTASSQSACTAAFCESTTVRARAPAEVTANAWPGVYSSNANISNCFKDKSNTVLLHLRSDRGTSSCNTLCAASHKHP